VRAPRPFGAGFHMRGRLLRRATLPGCRWQLKVLLLCGLLVGAGLSPTIAAAAPTTTAQAVTGPALPLYGQQWQPWGPENLGTSNVSIAGYGCALTAASMLLRTYGVNTNPGALNQWLIANGGYVYQNLLVWGAVARAAQAAGVSVSYVGWQSNSLSAIDGSLAAGNPVIAQVSLDGNMHFVLITGTGPDGTLWINDPWFADHTTFQSRYGNPATQIQSIRLYSGTPVASPQLSAMSAGGAEMISAPAGGLGTATGGAQVLTVPYTTSTTNWASGTPTTVGSWSDQALSFTAPAPLTAGSVVIETAAGSPNYWFPFTVTGVPAVTVTAVSPGSGPSVGGATVTIHGTGFQLPVAVQFGSLAALAVTLVSPTELQAVSPSGSGTEAVQVSDWMGTSQTTVADLFSYPVSEPPGVFIGLTPARICDTRGGNPSALVGAAAQCDGRTLLPGAPLGVNVEGIGGVPASGVSAVVLNVTVTNPSSGGYVTVYPAGQPPPLASNLDFAAGQTVANLTEVGLGAQGQIAVATGATSTDLVIDVTGYVAAPPTPGTGLYNGLPPTRICDTRTGTGPINQCTGRTMGGDSTLAVQVAGLAGVPASATGVALNVTATDTAAPSYLTVFPSGTPPTASNLNWTPGQTVANLVIATLNSTGGITFYNDAGSVDVVVDVVGYYTGSGGTGSQFNALSTPTRICDTRTGSGTTDQCTGSTMGPGATLAVQVAGLGGVPTGAISVVLNVTATDTTAPSYLTVFPSGPTPLASSLNWTAGQTVPNLVTANLNSTGGITLYNDAGSVDVVVDVMGWYS